MMRCLRIIGPVAVVLCLAASAFAQDGDGLRVREGDEMEARAGEAEANVAIRDLCVSLYPSDGKTKERRAEYPDWVKTLLCQYMIADFTDEARRKAYVTDVLGALRTRSAGQWRFSHRAPVIHIVTSDPAYWHKPDPEKAGKVVKIKKNSIRRSLRSPNAAAIGIGQSLFKTPRARNRGQADRRIPAAEDLIQRILAMAIVADLLAGTEAEITKKTADTRIKAGLADFKGSVLTAARIPNVGGQGFDKRPDAVNAHDNADSYSPPGENAGKNILTRSPAAGGSTVMIDKVKDGQAVGLTRTLNGLVLSQDIDRLAPRDVESIEPEHKLKPSYLLKVLVRTYLVIETFHGVPSGKNARKVLGVGGQDCTAAIAAHEGQHVEHFWTGWREQVVEKIQTDLAGRQFKNLKESTARSHSDTQNASPAGTKMRVTYLDILAGFVFPGDKRSSAEAARKTISTAYGSAAHGDIRKRFYKRVDELADAYHTDVQVGLNDDCEPVKDAALARRSFGKIGKSKKKNLTGVSVKKRKVLSGQ